MPIRSRCWGRMLGRRAPLPASSCPAREEVEAFSLKGAALGHDGSGSTRADCSKASCAASRSRCKYRCRAAWQRMVDHRSLQLRAGAGADRRSADRTGHAFPAVRQAGRASASSTRAPAASISRSGRPMPGRSAWSAISTTGTGARHAMRNRGDIGVWEIFIPDIGDGRAYKYRIIGPDGAVQPLKADPFAFASRTAAQDCLAHRAIPAKPDWGDEAHRAHWASVDPRRQADLDLRGPSRLVAARRAWLVPELG